MIIRYEGRSPRREFQFSIVAPHTAPFKAADCRRALYDMLAAVIKPRRTYRYQMLNMPPSMRPGLSAFQLTILPYCR